MPGLLFNPSHRRDFLKSTALASFALGISGGQTAIQASSGSDYRIALLSDTHTPGDQKNGHRGFNPWENLKQIVPEVLASKPESVLLCGDAARLTGLPEDYRELRALLQPIANESPIFIGLGNHDDRANFNQAFPNPAGMSAKVKDKHVLVIDTPAAQLILLDSLLYVNKTEGLLGKAQRDWLAAHLRAKSDKPAVIFVHHTLGENDGELLDSLRLFELLEGQRHVKAIFFGHSHDWNLARRGPLHLVNLPAVGYNFRDDEPVGWVEARFHARGVDLKLRAIAGNRAEDGKVTSLDWA